MNLYRNKLNSLGRPKWNHQSKMYIPPSVILKSDLNVDPHVSLQLMLDMYCLRSKYFNLGHLGSMSSFRPPWRRPIFSVAAVVALFLAPFPTVSIALPERLSIVLVTSPIPSHPSTQLVDTWLCVKTLVPLVNIKIAGKWMFIPLKMVLIAIDPYPVPVILKASPVFAGSLGAELKGSFGHSTGRPSRELPLRARLGFSCQNLRFEEPLIPTVLPCTCCFLGVNSKLWIIFLRATLQSVY